MALIRYPGAKAKLYQGIADALPDELIIPLAVEPCRYVEPFFGSGAVGIEVMRTMHPDSEVVIADADIGVASLWQAVANNPRELSDMVMRYTPSVASFYNFKESDGVFTDIVDTGFRKLALHRISVSGFGAMAGGPIGGRQQQGDYKVGCRWREDRIRADIWKLHALFKKFASIQIQHADVFATLDYADERLADFSLTFVYLDPPYFEKGDQLYAVKFSPAQHVQLCERLRGAKFLWAASYDDHPTIRKLYAAQDVRTLEVTYCNAVCREPIRRKNHEILIMPAKNLAAA